MTNRLYTNEEVMEIWNSVDAVENLVRKMLRDMIFVSGNIQTTFDTLSMSIKNIKDQLNITDENKIILNITNLRQYYGELKNNLKKVIESCDNKSKKLDIKNKNTLNNYIDIGLSLINHINRRFIKLVNTDTIKQSLQSHSSAFTSRLNTFKKCKKEINKIVKEHCNIKYDLSFIFDTIPNLDRYHQERTQIDVKGKLKTLFKEANNLKQKRKYLNSLIYLEYLKKLNKSFGDLGGLVINSDFNKSTYKNIKNLRIDISNEILNIQNSTLDSKLDEVINKKAQNILLNQRDS